MKKFTEHQCQTWEYNHFLHKKVEAARASMRAGIGYSNEETETKFAELKKRIRNLKQSS